MRLTRERRGATGTLLAAVLWIGGCSGQAPSAPPAVQAAQWSAAHVSFAPRVEIEARTPPAVSAATRPGAVVPRKGGGVYKVGTPYQIAGVWYYPREQPSYQEEGIASWYGHDFHAKSTANGEVFDMDGLTAAHRTLPMPSYVQVTNLENGRRVLLRVNDRGPFKKGRIIDVSKRAARELGFEGAGTARVHVRYMGRAPLDGDDHKERAFLTDEARRRAQVGAIGGRSVR